MSTASWVHTMEPNRPTSSSKYEDVMAEFRANGRDSDTSSVTGGRSTSGTPASLVTPGSPSPTSNQTQNMAGTPCSLCGVCSPINVSANEFTPSKDIGSGMSASNLSSAGMSPSSATVTSLNSQFTNMDINDLQQQFGAGLRKLLVDKPNLRQESSWPFVRRDYSQVNLAAANGIENIWQLAPGQYPRTSNITTPIGSLSSSQLQRLQQLRQKKPGFIVDGFQECVFCRNNGESVSFYRSHELKDQLGRVICPILRAFSCPCCGATGDNAHTIKYCPEKGPDFIPGLSQLKSLRIPNTKRRVSVPRRFTGTPELGTWFAQE